jgi:hypothetical protein
LEEYQTLERDLQTNLIEVVDRTEKISVSWFTTAGSFSDSLTEVDLTKTLDTVYTAPDTPPATTGGLATVWLVARDQRGGESWEHVDLLIQ